MKRFILYLALLCLLASCSSSQYATKCNGKRGTRVPMGVL